MSIANAYRKTLEASQSMGAEHPPPDGYTLDVLDVTESDAPDHAKSRTVTLF